MPWLMPPLLAAVLLTSLSAASSPSAHGLPCLGEFQHCPNTSECTLFGCGRCGLGQYRCPLSGACVDGAAGYMRCPGLSGTHLDHTLGEEARLDWLVARTTLAEQAAQLTNAAPPLERLGMPGYNWCNDDLHGVRGNRSTIFPEGNTLGASFNASLLAAVGASIGREARATHHWAVCRAGQRQDAFNGAGLTLYAPHVNLVRDPRWGRAQEVYSEDPRLSSALAAAFVAGAQRPAQWGDGRSGYLQVAACCKHAVAYDLEWIRPPDFNTSRMHFDARPGARSFWEHYVPVFRACVAAGAQHVMCSYNALNGQPTCAEPRLLNGLFRQAWGFDGFVVSDYGAWDNLVSSYHVAANFTEAAALGLNAGLDQCGGGTKPTVRLPEAVARGLTSAGRVAEAFRRLFRVRLRLGMLDPPTLVPQARAPEEELQSAANMALARRAAVEGMVLIQNSMQGGTGATVLPLSLDALAGRGGSVLVSGPNAAARLNTLGNYACDGGAESCLTPVTSILGGLVNGSRLSSFEVRYEPGCATTDCNVTSFGDAPAAARGAQVSILVLGTTGYDTMAAHGNASAWEREGHDRTSIQLAGRQLALAAALAPSATGTPLVCVLIHGGSLALSSLRRDCGAILSAGYPGVMGGAGFVDVLFGAVSPAGRAPQTFYEDDGELPAPGEMDLYAHRGTTYRYYRGVPAVPFGFGLSYTTFEYRSLTVVREARPCADIAVEATVRNTGTRHADEVVQLYVETPEASVPAPRVRLADFARVHVRRGEEVRVSLTVTAEYHSVVLDASQFWQPLLVVEPGEIRLSVGGGQPGHYAGTLQAAVRIVGTGVLSTSLACSEDYSEA